MEYFDPYAASRQGQQNLQQTLASLNEQNMQRGQMERQNRLSDLQFADLSRKAQQDSDLQAALQTPQAMTTFAPEQAGPQMSLSSGLQADPSLTPITGRQQETPAQTIARVRMGQGRTEEAAKALSLDDAIAQYGAKLQAGGGDMQSYYKAKNELDQGKEFFGTIKDYAKQPELLKAMWPLVVKAYPSAAAVDPSSIRATGDGLVSPLHTPDGAVVPGKFYLYDNEGKIHIIDKKEDDNLTREQLIAKAIRGDKSAIAILDETDRRDVAGKKASRQVIVNNPMPAKMNVNMNGLSTDEQDALSRAIDNGLDPYKINSRTAKIYAQQEIKAPGRKWNELGAAAAFERNSGVMNSKALLNTIDPLLTKLETAGQILGNSSLPGYNKAVNFLKEQGGSADIVGFNNLRDDVVAEVERGLMGSGVLSDSKYNRAIKNINSAQSLPQLKAAIANTKIVIKARLESLANGPSGGKPSAGKKPLSSY